MFPHGHCFLPSVISVSALWSLSGFSMSSIWKTQIWKATFWWSLKAFPGLHTGSLIPHGHANWLSSCLPLPLLKYLSLNLLWVSLHDPFPLSFSCLSHLSPCSSWGLCNPRLPAKVQQGRGGDHLRGRRSFYEEALLKGGLGLLSLFCHLPSLLGLLTLSLCLSCISWTHRASRPPRKTKPVRGKEWSGLWRVNARSLDGWRGLLVTLLKSRGRVPPCHLLCFHMIFLHSSG